MKRNVIVMVGIMLVAPAMLWMAPQVFGYGAGFDKPLLPQGAHLDGPAGKGTVTYSVSGSSATISFQGRCGNGPVSTGQIDVSVITDETAFVNATEKQVADQVEEWFIDSPLAVAPFQPCYKHAAIGIYVTAINKSLSKTSTGPNSAVWVGEVTIQGVRF